MKIMIFLFLQVISVKLIAASCEQKGIMLLGEITYLKKNGNSFEKKSIYRAIEKRWNGNSNFYKRVALSGVDEIPENVNIKKLRDEKVLDEKNYTLNRDLKSRTTIDDFSFMRDLYPGEENLPIQVKFIFKNAEEKFCEAEISLEKPF